MIVLVENKESSSYIFDVTSYLMVDQTSCRRPSNRSN